MPWSHLLTKDISARKTFVFNCMQSRNDWDGCCLLLSSVVSQQELNSTWKHVVKIGSRSELYCYTHSLILTTYAALPPIEGSNHKNSNDFKPNLHFKSCEGQLWTKYCVAQLVYVWDHVMIRLAKEWQIG